MYRRFAPIALATALAGGASCGRSKGVSDEQLGGLVVEPKAAAAPIDVAKAARDPGELGRVLARPHRELVEALGPHTATIDTTNLVTESDKPVSELTDHAV
ncbi:MAG: hypothetical protein ACTHU0_36775, partial [Kofleriaceae bacterium]